MENREKGFSRLKLLLLNLLSKSPMHGYALMKELERLLGTRPSPGTIYPLLRDMVSEGLLEVKTSETGGRVTKIYYVTEKGLQYLRTGMRELRNLLAFIDGARIAREHGYSLNELTDTLARLIAALPQLPERERRRVLDFLARIYREAKKLLEEIGA